MNSTDISRDVTRDLQAVLTDMSPEESARAWKSALRSAAARVRKAAVAGARAAIKHNGSKAARTIKVTVRRDGSGFAVRAVPTRKHPTAGVITNRWGDRKPVVMWSDTGVSKATHSGWKQDLKAHRFMERARGTELAGALAQVRDTVMKRAEKIIQKRIKNSYGK